jgi:hypothetical protein
MRRSLKIAVVLVATAIWGALSWALYPFVVADRCLDAGGALDAATRMCIRRTLVVEFVNRRFTPAPRGSL